MKWDDNVEPKIRILVNALNAISGVKTCASCQGHAGFRGKKTPYVMFYSTEKYAAALEKILREDASSGQPRLSTFWTVCGFFDGAYRLAYRLIPPRYGFGEVPTIRAFTRLRRDLETLAEIAREAGSLIRNSI